MAEHIWGSAWFLCQQQRQRQGQGCTEVRWINSGDAADVTAAVTSRSAGDHVNSTLRSRARRLTASSLLAGAAEPSPTIGRPLPPQFEISWNLLRTAIKTEHRLPCTTTHAQSAPAVSVESVVRGDLGLTVCQWVCVYGVYGELAAWPVICPLRVLHPRYNARWVPSPMECVSL